MVFCPPRIVEYLCENAIMTHWRQPMTRKNVAPTTRLYLCSEAPISLRHLRLFEDVEIQQHEREKRLSLTKVGAPWPGNININLRCPALSFLTDDIECFGPCRFYINRNSTGSYHLLLPSWEVRCSTSQEHFNQDQARMVEPWNYGPRSTLRFPLQRRKCGVEPLLSAHLESNQRRSPTTCTDRR